jgi:hypothetical protein
MLQQSLLRTIKRWKRYLLREAVSEIPRMTRGFYVLYRKGEKGRYDFRYIGVGGLGAKAVSVAA